MLHLLLISWLVVTTIIWLAIAIRSLFGADASEVHSWESWSKSASQNLGKAAGVASVQGRRPHMEDTYRAAVALDSDEKAAFFAVFDGHGGPRAAVFTAEHLHHMIKSRNFRENPKQALTESFLQLDSHWLQMAETNSWDDGTTAISVLVIGSTIHVANVGDSRAVLASSGKAVAMSSDHKPDRTDERQRIEKLGGRISWCGILRVEGMLAVTRAIGDRRLKKFVSAEPEIATRDLSSEDDFLVLASDGLWDVLSNQEAVDIVYRAKNVKDAADALTQTAYKLGSMDNITSLVIDLRVYHR